MEINMIEKYGFIYIWYDRKHKRYYIGCHWGTIDDGYICSSTWMKRAYKRRSQDFKRKIVRNNIDNKQLMREIEYQYLSLIKEEELGKRYYNLHNHKLDHWSDNPQSKLTVGEKISKAHKSNPDFGKWNIGKVLSEETKQKISESTSIAMKEYYKENPRSEETCKKISENNKRLHLEGKIGTKGMKYTEESRKKMSEWQLGINNPMYGKKHSEETRKKISESMKKFKNKC